MGREIWVVPFFGQGHLLPSIELCKHLTSRNFKTVLVISSNLSSSIPSSFRHHPLLEVAELPSSPQRPPPPTLPRPVSDPHLHHGRHTHHDQMAQELENLIMSRSKNEETRLVRAAVVDVMMGWSGEIFYKFEVPTIGFFTSGACSAAMEYVTWEAEIEGLKPGEIRLVPGFPEEMAITDSDLKLRPDGPPPPGAGGGPHDFGPGGPPPPHPDSGFPGQPGDIGPPKVGPHGPGGQPPWLEVARGSKAFIINTCDDLERPFLEYLANQTEKPVWGVGPLLPEQYWKSLGSLVHDHEIRSNRRSNVTEDEVTAWLDSKARSSVLFVSFGSEVGPNMEEYPQLAAALEASNRPFIWVIQPGSGRRGPPPPQFLGNHYSESDEGYFPHGLDKRVGDRGLIIQGWAPQLLILSHQSTGGFLSHCGWNSIMEAIGRGMPILAWPIRGDQIYNAKLAVKHLKIGCMICEDQSEMMKKDDIAKGIERLFGDEEIKNRAVLLGAKFEHGFPCSSVESLDALRDFISHKAV